MERGLGRFRRRFGRCGSLPQNCSLGRFVD